MKIAIPTKGNVVDDHFGHCEAYSIISTSDSKTISDIEMMPSPQGCGCKSNIIPLLKEKGVKVMLAGNMGAGALNKIQSNGIEVVRGCSGDVKAIAEAYLKNELNDSGVGCDHHHEEGHQCQH